MRIGLFTDVYPPNVSGVATSVVMLKNALEKAGHHVYIVTVNSQNLKYKYYSHDHTIRMPGIKTGIYDYRLTSIYSIKAARQIKRWKLDIIHSHTEFGIGTFARIIAKQFNIPLVHTYHTMYEEYVNHAMKGYLNVAGNKFIEYLTMFYCDKTISELIVPTEKTKELFKNKYKVTRDIHIIPTGIEIERFSKERFSSKKLDELRKKLNIDNNDFVILYLGRLGKEKDIDFLLENHHDLIINNKHYKLLIVGDGPQLEHLKMLVNQYKIKDNVIFSGKVEWEKVPIYYQIADIFVTPSKAETQGLTVIEAMASSKPVVCINDPSYKDMVIDNYNGLYFNNAKEYKSIIKHLSNNNEDIKRMSKYARESVELYSTNYYVRKVLEVYRLAVTKQNKSRIPFLDNIKKMFGGDKNEKNSCS